MRAFELIFEDTLAAADFYKKDRLDAFINKLEKKEPFIVNRQEQVINATPDEIAKFKNFYKFYNEIGDARKVDATANLPKSVGGIPLSKIEKTGEFGGKGAYNVEKAGLGVAVEVLKSVALYAKLTDRTNQPITVDTIKSILSTLKDTAKLGRHSAKSKTQTYLGRLQTEVPDQQQTIKDTINLVVQANEGSFLRAVALTPRDKDALGSLNGILKYVNTDPEMARYNKFFSQNNRKDAVNVSIVGGQGGKTDVKTTYVDPVSNQERTLKSLSMSLKAGKSPSFDQAPGTNEKGIRDFFNILGFESEVADNVINKTQFQAKKSSDEPIEDLRKRQQAAAKIMQLAGDYVEKKYFSKNDKGEAAFINDFFKNIIKSITKDEPLIYVEFNADGTYDKLNPRNIMNLVNYVDLYSDHRISKDGVNYLFFRDKNTGKALFHIRLLVSKAERIAFLFVLNDLISLVKEATEYKNKNISRG